jgi:hypothetical protein
MSKPADHGSGFFPNFVSLLIFILIMAGMFFGFTKVYPQLALHYLQSRNVTPPEGPDKVAEIAPFVRGVISGVKTANLSSIRESGALNINELKGYQYGVRTALLTSKNWHNIDRQLFRVRGIELGMLNSLQTSRVNQQRATLSFQVKLIQQIQTALNVNLEELLNENSDSRAVVLQNYVANLKKLANEANLEVENMTRIVDEFQEAFDQANQASEQFSDGFSNETSEFITDNIDANLDQYLEARKNAETARVRISSTAEILNRLAPLAQRLPQVISAIEANVEALSAGIKITPTPGVNLPLIQGN